MGGGKESYNRILQSADFISGTFISSIAARLIKRLIRYGTLVTGYEATEGDIGPWLAVDPSLRDVYLRLEHYVNISIDNITSPLS